MAISVSRYLRCKDIIFFKIEAVLFKMSEFRRVAGRYILFCYLKIIPGCRARFSRPGKCSPGTEQGFPTRENVPLEPGKVFPLWKMFLGNRARFSRLGKCSPETGQGFPAWENVPLEPGKVFPLGKMFLGNRARFSRLGKCSPGTEQGFPAWENVPLKPSKVFPSGEMFLGNRARFSRSGKCPSETEQGFPCQFHYEQFLCWPNSFMWRAYAIRPYIFTFCSLGIR